MGSRLSAQVVIDKGRLYDQNHKSYSPQIFETVCVASQKACDYCKISKKYKKYDMHDRQNQDDNFLSTAIETAEHIHNRLKKGKNVLVHCHSGRNRSALSILVYCAMYTDKTFDKALQEIRKQNSSRFDPHKTLQNTQFTSKVREKWDELKLKSEKSELRRLKTLSL